MLKYFIKKYIPQGKYWNKFYQKIYHFALWGMNFNRFENLEISGEKSSIRFISKSLAEKKSGILFDVGANTGAFTLLLDKLFGGSFQIYAFEPVKKTFDLLCENTNRIDKVKPQHLGLSNHNGKQQIYFSDQLESQASLTQSQNVGQEGEWITLKTIDQFCQENKIAEIDFLKVDVEGYDLHVLQGGQELMANSKIKFIQFEFGGTNIQAKVFFKDFWEYLNPQYNIYRILKNGLLPITKYEDNLEIFQFCNYLAVLK